jgi:hypothetical protein
MKKQLFFANFSQGTNCRTTIINDLVRNLFLLGILVFLSNCAQKLRFSDPNTTFLNVKIAEENPNDGYGPCEPSIAVSLKNPQNVAAGAILDRYYWSNDGGKTWENNQLKSRFGVFGDPVLVPDSDGNFYYLHLSDTLGKGWADDRLMDRIVIQKSTDGGKNYDLGSATGFAHPKDQDKPWAITDPKTGAVYVTWTEFDLYNSKQPTDHSRILFSGSKDGGKTWSNPLIISELEGDCLDQDLTTEGAVPAVGPNGEIYVSWSFDSKIWFDKSLDGGKTWLEKDIILAEQPGGWSFEIPGLNRTNGMPVTVCDLSNGPNRGTIYVNWSDQRAGISDTDIFLAKSADGGKTWSKSQKINTDKSHRQQFLNWLAIDQTTGFLYSVFYDRRSHKNSLKTDVVIAVSKNGGKKWKNYRVSDAPFEPLEGTFFGDYSGISAHGGIIRPIWTRFDGGKLSIWTAIFEVK